MPAAPPDITAPSPWVRRFAGLVAPGGRVLDVAAGRGRHARFFHGRGHPVTAVDRDTTPLADLAQIPGAEVVRADLEDGRPWPFAGRSFAAVVVVNYLYRPLLPALIDAVRPDGVLLYATFMRGNEAFSRPRDPAHLLAPGELLAAFGHALRPVAFDQGRIERGDIPGVVQRLCAVGPRRPGPDPLPAPDGGS